MINIFTNEYPNQQAHRRHAAINDRRHAAINDRRHAAINDRRRNRCCGNGFAVFAGVLGADVTMYGKYGGYDIQLFGHIFTDFD